MEKNKNCYNSVGGLHEKGKGLQSDFSSLYSHNEETKLSVFDVSVCAEVNNIIRQELHLLWAVTCGLKEIRLVVEPHFSVSLLCAAVILLLQDEFDARLS